MDDCEKRTYHRGPFRVIAAIIMGIFAATAISLITAVFIMLLWNWLMPAIFGLGVIGFWKAFGLSLLARLLFCGFTKHFSGGPRKWSDKRWGNFEYHRGKYHSYKRFDDVYEDWWESEGSKSFEEYLKKDKENKEE